MRNIIFLAFVLTVFETGYSQNSYSQSKQITLNDLYCPPNPEGLVVFYDIDGIVINCETIASSNNYCVVHTNIEGLDLNDAYKHGKVKYVRIRRHYNPDDMAYLSYSDEKKYDIHGYYYDNDKKERHFIYHKFKTRLPIIINDTIYYHYSQKHDAVRKYKYNDLSVNLLEPSKAKIMYGRRARYGALIVNVPVN